ncbi:hypothetical protein ACFUJY_30185 [Streptomyces sp. NPDC057249]|uniref:hypothetical protein n=1 Tax=Streptomyces sp. NPDC057249 TaxID=3346067 RepID=UPI003633062C
MSRRHSRTSFSHALRRMVHATEDLVDDALDRAGDFERGVRHSLSDALDDDRRPRDRDHDDHDDHDDDHDHDGHDRRRGPDRRQAGRPARDDGELRALTEQISLLADRLERHRDSSRQARAGGTVPPPRDAEDLDAVRADLATLAARLDRISDVAR